MPSLFQRFSSAARAFMARGGVPPMELGYYGQHMGMPALFQPEQSLRAYGDNVWLYRAVQTIAMQIACTDFKLRTKTKKGEVKLIESHQSLELLKKPQPSAAGKSMLTGMDLKLIAGMHLLLNGEAFWLLDRRMAPGLGGSPTFITPLLAQYMEVNLSKGGEVLEYTYRLPSQKFTFDPMDVVHYKLSSPLTPYRGHSPVQSIRYAVDTHKKADEMNTKKLDNYAVPSGVLETDQPVSDGERHKILTEFTSKYAGSRNAGKTAMLPKGLHYKKTEDTNQDMQFVEGKNLTRDEILANYGVGLEIMGRTEAQTRANAEAAIFVFQKFGVLPFLMKMNDTLNNDYLPAFPNPAQAEFFFDDPVPENMEEKRANLKAAFEMGATTPNEVRKALNMEPLNLPGMDTPYVPISAIPVGEEAVEPNVPAE